MGSIITPQQEAKERNPMPPVVTISVTACEISALGATSALVTAVARCAVTGEAVSMLVAEMIGPAQLAIGPSNGASREKVERNMRSAMDTIGVMLWQACKAIGAAKLVPIESSPKSMEAANREGPIPFTTTPLILSMTEQHVRAVEREANRMRAEAEKSAGGEAT